MDVDYFDALAQSLSTAGSRRTALIVAGAGISALLGRVDDAVGKGGGGKKKKKKNKKKKRTPECDGGLVGVPCGETCCEPVSEKCCDGVCIPSLSCCLPEGVFANGARYDQCGVCQDGMLQPDPAVCRAINPTGCTICSGYECISGNEELPCADGGGSSVCGVCTGGRCVDKFTRGAPRAGCGPICCPSTLVCCPERPGVPRICLPSLDLCGP